MDSFFIYRLPKDNRFNGGIGYSVEGISPGFLISSFYNIDEATITIIKQEELTLDSLQTVYEKIGDSLSSDTVNSSLFPFPDKSTSKEEYVRDVNHIISGLKEHEKTVYCRVIIGDGKINLKETLISLADSLPEAMVFCFHSPRTGTWLGASPEMLLSFRSGCFSTMALAGTRNANDNREWDAKNLEEQRMVTEYISDVFNKHSIPFFHDAYPSTKRAGKIEHLCTNFKSKKFSVLSYPWLKSFLYDLSPTPALCGLPKKNSLNTIKFTETFSRAFYGGFMGPVESLENFSLYVILRSVRIEGKRWCMFAGGGITQCSIAEYEWEETNNKAASILEKFQLFK